MKARRFAVAFGGLGDVGFSVDEEGGEEAGGAEMDEDEPWGDDRGQNRQADEWLQGSPPAEIFQPYLTVAELVGFCGDVEDEKREKE